MPKIEFMAWLTAGFVLLFYGAGLVGLVWDLYRGRSRKAPTLPPPIAMPPQEERQSAAAFGAMAYLRGRLTPAGLDGCVAIEHLWEERLSGARPGWTLLWPGGMFVYVHSDGSCSFSPDGKGLAVECAEPDRVLAELGARGMARAETWAGWRCL